MKIVALGHRRGVGKDTFASYLASHLRTSTKGAKIRRIGFATRLKEIADDLWGIGSEQHFEINYTSKEMVIPEFGKSPREMWIELGEAMRAIYKNTWVEAPFRTPCDYLIIKDLRYPNEFAEVVKRGGICIRLDNPRVEKFNDPADSALAGFEHEWHRIITNEGSLKELNEKVIAFAKEVFN